MTRPIVYVVFASLLWGTTGTAAFFLGSSLSPLAIGAATMGLGGAILALVGGRATVALWRSSASRLWLLAGALGVVVYPLTFYSGMATAGIALGNVIALGLGPVTAALLEWWIDKRAPRTVWWIASLSAIAGIAVMSMSKVELGGGRPGNVTVGVVLAVVAGLSYGLFTYVFGKLIDHGHSPRAVAGGVFGAGAPILLIVLGVTAHDVSLGVGQFGIVAYLVLGPMVLAYIAITASLSTLRASSVATVALLEPVVATLLAVLVVGELLGPLALVGIAIVLVSLTLFALSRGAQARA
ncbi:MAG: hypothetical protein RL187_252 [Actinomycetota bacterium]